jgi:glycosyltransferase involved in cell wall biosynthesis
MMQVSVIIPVYCAAEYVANAVESALDQPKTGEVVLVEDGSPDASLAACERLEAAHERVRLLRHPGGVNRGAAASRNLGIQSARSPFVAFLDADDYYLPERFDRASVLFGQDETIDGVYDAVGQTFETKEAEAWWKENRSDRGLTTVTEALPPEELFKALLTYSHGHFCTDGITVRRALFERTGLFLPGLSMSEDTLMWWKLAIMGRLVGGSLDEAVAMRRVHDENTIIQNHERKWIYEYLARRALLRWLPKSHRTPERVDLIHTSLLVGWRRTVRLSYPRWQRGLRQSLMLAGLLVDDPAVVWNDDYRHCLKEVTGLLYLRNLIKGKNPV